MGEYSDDDFDDLPESALQQLEENAIQSTQAPRRVAPTKQLLRPNPPPFDTLGLDDDDADLELDDSDVFKHSVAPIPEAARAQPSAADQSSRSYLPGPSQGVSGWNGRPNTSAASQATRALPNPSQGLSRWNVRAPNAPANIPRHNGPNPPFRPPALRNWPQPSQSALHNPPQPSQSFRQPSVHNTVQPNQFPRGFAPPPQRYAPSQSQAPLPTTALEERLRALENELNVSKGEASILRANSTKVQQANEAEIARLQRQCAEQEARHERALQSALQAERATATELQFAQREMREVTDRARRRDAAPPGAGATTPRKGARTWGVADGFDGMDLVPSPGKGMPRTKSAPMPTQGERTPTKGKRKRPVESPVPPLDTTEEFVVEGRGGDDVAPTPVAVPAPTSLYKLPFDVSFPVSFICSVKLTPSSSSP